MLMELEDVDGMCKINAEQELVQILMELQMKYVMHSWLDVLQMELVVLLETHAVNLSMQNIVYHQRLDHVYGLLEFVIIMIDVKMH